MIISFVYASLMNGVNHQIIIICYCIYAKNLNERKMLAAANLRFIYAPKKEYLLSIISDLAHTYWILDEIQSVSYK